MQAVVPCNETEEVTALTGQVGMGDVVAEEMVFEETSGILSIICGPDVFGTEVELERFEGKQEGKVVAEKAPAFEMRP